MKNCLILCLLLPGFHFLFSQAPNNSVVNIFFDVNKHELNKEQLAQLDELIRKKVTITCVRGFADSTGSTSYNLELSHKRAKAVYGYLRDHNPSVIKISYEYLGEQPAGENDLTYERRVEVCYSESILAEKGINQQNDTVLKVDISAKIKAVDDLAIIGTYELSNIYFIPDKAILEPSSFFAVDDVAKYLKRFPGCTFEIVGHVNYAMPPSAMKNPKNLEPAQKLSEERAKTVYDLLVERGISIHSMAHKGVGNTQMVYKNPKNENERRKNMRVEILIACKK